MALAGGLQLVFLFRHELKAGEGVVAPHPIGLGHHLGQLGGHQRLEGHRVLRQGPRPALGADEVVQQEHPGLIAGDLDIVSLPVLYLNGHSVRVWASTSLASFWARAKLSGVSGLGDFTVGKVPSMTICSGTQCRYRMPSCSST